MSLYLSGNLVFQTVVLQPSSEAITSSTCPLAPESGQCHGSTVDSSAVTSGWPIQSHSKKPGREIQDSLVQFSNSSHTQMFLALQGLLEAIFNWSQPARENTPPLPISQNAYSTPGIQLILRGVGNCLSNCPQPLPILGNIFTISLQRFSFIN